MLTLTTGARLRLAAWNGDTFSVALVPEGRFAAVAANLGPDPLGLAQFLVDAEGKWKGFTFTMEADGQTVDFVRQPPAP